MFRIGLFDTDYTPTAIPVAAHHAVARAVQAKAITLLKNSGHALPLRREAGKSIAVIGADANILAAESGSAWVDPTVSTPTLQGITARAGGRRQGQLHPRQRPSQRRLHDRDGRHDGGPVLGAHPGEGDRTRPDRPILACAQLRRPPAVTRVERQVNYDVDFASTFPNWAGASTQVPPPPVNFFLGPPAVLRGLHDRPDDGRIRAGADRSGDATLSLDGTRSSHDRQGRPPGRQLTETPPRRGEEYALHRIPRHPATDRPQPGTVLLQWRPPAGGGVAGDPRGGGGGEGRRGGDRLTYTTSRPSATASR